MKYQKGFISYHDFVQFMIVLVLIGIGIVISYLFITILWELVKSLIHAATE